MWGFRYRRARRLAFGAVSLLALWTAGCGETRYPVAGRVLVNGQPLKGKVGSVVLKPDASKGNKRSGLSEGVLQRDGNFEVLTNNKPGAPRGWYKVIVTAYEPAANPNEDSRPALNARYATEANTPLEIEVVANPASDQYDLQLSP
jgi:hypothetical protein